MGEAFCLPSCSAALHVDDLAVADRKNLEPFLAATIGTEPLRRADDHVVADLAELRLHLDTAPGALADLEGQDLTGLVGAVSGGCALPPQMAVRDAAPRALVADAVSERPRVASVECFGRGAKLIDHVQIMPPAIGSLLDD